MYQYYKIKAIGLKAIPQPIEGSYPPTAWAYLLGNEDMTIAYDAIPRLPGSKIIPNTRTTTRYFKRVGRQFDFNWYNNTTSYVENSDFTLRLRFASTPNQAVFIFQITVFLEFSMLVEQTTSGKQEIFETARTQPTMPVVDPEVIKELNESVTSFNLTTSNLDISQVGENKENQGIEVVASKQEPEWPKYRYRKSTHGMLKQVKYEAGGKWVTINHGEELPPKPKPKPKKSSMFHYGDSEDEEDIKLPKRTKPVEIKGKPLEMVKTEIGGVKMLSEKPLTKGQINTVLAEQADKIADPFESLLTRIANKTLEQQIQAVQKQIDRVGVKNMNLRVQLEEHLEKLQAKLAQELLNDE
jgi:hypothetical protein